MDPPNSDNRPPTMTNPFPEELISAYLDDQLSPSERQRFETLLETNTEHRRVLDDLIAIRRDLQALPRNGLDVGFSDRVLAAIQARKSPSTQSLPDDSHIASLATPARMQKQNDRAPAWQWLVAGTAALVLAIGLSVNWLPDRTPIGMNSPKVSETAKPVASQETMASPAVASAPAKQEAAEGAPDQAANFAAAPPQDSMALAPAPHVQPSEGDLKSVEIANANLREAEAGQAQADGIRPAKAMRRSATVAEAKQLRKKTAQNADAAESSQEIPSFDDLKNLAQDESRQGELVIHVSVANRLESERLIRDMLASHDFPGKPQADSEEPFPLRNRSQDRRVETLQDAAPNQKGLGDEAVRDSDLIEVVLEASPESLSRFLTRDEVAESGVHIVDASIVRGVGQAPGSSDLLSMKRGASRKMADAASNAQLAASAKGNAELRERAAAADVADDALPAGEKAKGAALEAIAAPGAAAMAAAPADNEPQLAKAEKKSAAPGEIGNKIAPGSAVPSDKSQADFGGGRGAKPGSDSQRQLLGRGKVRVRFVFVPAEASASEMDKPAESPAEPASPASPE